LLVVSSGWLRQPVLSLVSVRTLFLNSKFKNQHLVPCVHMDKNSNYLSLLKAVVRLFSREVKVALSLNQNHAQSQHSQPALYSAIFQPCKIIKMIVSYPRTITMLNPCKINCVRLHFEQRQFRSHKQR
jgi:hypothetical protein